MTISKEFVNGDGLVLHFTLSWVKNENYNPLFDDPRNAYNWELR